MNNDISLNEDDNKNLYELDGEKYNLIKMVEEEIIDENGNKKIVLVKYVKLNLYEKNKESYKKANKKYAQTHRKELNEYNKNLYKERYDNDPEFREKEKAKSRERYLKKKEFKKSESES